MDNSDQSHSDSEDMSVFDDLFKDIHNFYRAIQLERNEKRYLQRKWEAADKTKYEVELKLQQYSTDLENLKATHEAVLATMKKKQYEPSEIATVRNLVETLTAEKEELLKQLDSTNEYYLMEKRKNKEIEDINRDLKIKASSAVENHKKLLNDMDNLKLYFKDLEDDQKSINDLISETKITAIRSKNAFNYQIQQYAELKQERDELHANFIEAQFSNTLKVERNTSPSKEIYLAELKELTKKTEELTSELQKEQSMNMQLRNDLSNTVLINNFLSKQLENANKESTAEENADLSLKIEDYEFEICEVNDNDNEENEPMD